MLGQGLIRRWSHRKAIRAVYRPLMRDWRAWKVRYGHFKPGIGRDPAEREVKRELLADYQRLRAMGCKQLSRHIWAIRALRGD